MPSAEANPFRSNKLTVTDTFYKSGTNLFAAPGHSKKETQKKSLEARSNICYILSAMLAFLAMFLLPLGTLQGVQNQFSLGLSICHSARFLCGLPKAMLPVNITPLCELATQMHDHIPSSLHRCAATPIAATGLATQAPITFPTNFASPERGASIITEFTSPTHGLPTPSIFASIIFRFTGIVAHYPNIRRSITLLDEHIVDGECWEFSAVDGRVGIRLSENINVSHISLNYIPTQQISLYARSKVPQDISIWGLMQDTVASQIIPAGIPVHEASYFLEKGSHLPSFVNSSSRFAQLTRFRYDASSGPWQQFSIPSTSAQVSSTQIIIAAFETNKGASTTCVYTIGIHGVPTSL